MTVALCVNFELLPGDRAHDLLVGHTHGTLSVQTLTHAGEVTANTYGDRGNLGID